MPTIAWGVIALLVVVLGWWLLRRRTSLPALESGFDLDSWQPRTVRPLTKVELSALARIKLVAPECLVLPQVSLSRFLRVKSALPYSPWFHHVGRRCVDFLVCSPNGDVLGVIELIDNKNAGAPPSRGEQAKERTLTLAAIPVWHIDPQAPHALDQLHDYIYAELGDSVASPSLGAEWHSTDTAPRGAGIEAIELDDDRWNQPWPSEETRPTAYLDLAELPKSDK
jgi:hypothetical protein